LSTIRRIGETQASGRIEKSGGLIRRGTERTGVSAGHGVVADVAEIGSDI
jgi:hypothetical protein